MIRVALVDDHAVVRAGYRRLLELEVDIRVDAEYPSAEAAQAALVQAERREVGVAVDVLVLDLSMPGLSGLDFLRRLKLRWPALPVLIFTMHESAAMLQQCLRLGASGFITKTSAPELLVDAVRRVARGEQAISPGLADAANRAERPPPHLRLSTREFDVLHRLLDGRNVDEIAQAMRLSPKTIANYQTEIRQKLGVVNTVELLAYARLHAIGPR